MATENATQYAFLRGWNQLPRNKTNTVREEIREALNGISLPTFYSRLRGIPEPKISEAKAIEEIFARHGISEVWGE